MQPFEFSPWLWREPAVPGAQQGEPGGLTADRRASEDLVGYAVEALDGKIGSIDQATYETGSSYVVVDTGPWIFGHKVLLPAGTVQRVDREDKKVYVDRTKEQIKNSPEYDKETAGTPEYRDKVGAYYSDSYRDVPPAAG